MLISVFRSARRRQGLFAFFASLVVLVWSNSLTVQSLGAPINVGTIALDQYQTTNDGTLGGVNVQFRFVPNAAFAMQNHVTDVRWLQRVTTSAATGFTPNPNRPFIDPRQGQNIGGGAMGDALPFYDITYNSAADRNTNTNRVANGSGRFYNDSPRVLLNRSPFTFMAETLLVGVEDLAMKKLAILGGVKWGFTFAGMNPVTVTALPLMALSDSNALRNNFNTALGLDFPGWTIISPAEWDQEQVTVTAVPEPSTSAMLVSVAIGLAVISLNRRRRRHV